jgi:NUMOD4 motif-containing protein
MTGHYKKDNENALCFKCNKKPRYPLQSYCYKCAYEKGRIYITKKLEKKRLERAKIKVKAIKGEIWKRINGYEHYKVSNKGRVVSCMRLDSGRNMQQNEKLLKATIDSKGYRGS